RLPEEGTAASRGAAARHGRAAAGEIGKRSEDRGDDRLGTTASRLGLREGSRQEARIAFRDPPASPREPVEEGSENRRRRGRLPSAGEPSGRSRKPQPGAGRNAIPARVGEIALVQSEPVGPEERESGSRLQEKLRRELPRDPAVADRPSRWHGAPHDELVSLAG